MCLSIAIARPHDMLSQGAYAGFEWIIMHNGFGFRCGYVRLPQGHPWHGMDYDDIPADVHGGLTFAEYDEPCEKTEEDLGYWIGFDCAHGGDAQDLTLLGAHSHIFPSYAGQTVKDQAYVEQECRKLCGLADQVDVIDLDTERG